MERFRKRGLILLAAASALATVGLGWLAIRASAAMPGWTWAAAGSPLALKCLAIIIVGAAVLAVLGLALARVRQVRVRAVRGFHGDQGGTAAIEMAFVFPLGLMIFLTITQAALLFNANMVVNYAAFAAARMATVVVPMSINDEGHNLVWPPSSASSQKLELIRRAAVLALVPVSARLTSADAQDPQAPAVHDQAQSTFGHFGAQAPAWFRRIEPQYNYAAANTQIELAAPEHWQDGNPDNDCPYHNDRRDQWSQWGWTYVPFCPYFHHVPPIWDFWFWEDLHVRVTYPYLLEVPYASRFLGDAEITLPDRTGTQYVATIPVTVSLSNEGETEVRPAGEP
jgi:hypothetical protein